MLRRIPISQQRLLCLPLILVMLHILFMLGVGYTWYQSVQEYGVLAGPKANTAWKLVRWVDFPASWFSERVFQVVVCSKSPAASKFLQWMGMNTLDDVELGLHWPLLLVLGSMQWFLIGLGVAWVRRSRFHHEPSG